MDQMTATNALQSHCPGQIQADKRRVFGPNPVCDDVGWANPACRWIGQANPACP